jgi:hypothetical protein
MKHGAQPDAMKALALRSSRAALVMTNGEESALFYLDPDGFVIDEVIYCAARVTGFTPVAVIGLTPDGIRTHSEIDLPGVMHWARGAFCARLCESPEAEIKELERIHPLEDNRNAN